MTAGQLLGRVEGPHLEFMAAEALEDMASLAREVVAFLNAEGGEILVGIEEEKGRAIRLQTIEQIDVRCRSLEECFLDTIEPPPSGSMVRVEPNRGILRISVEAGNEKPYCRVRRSERLFVIRAGARIRPLTREEIRKLMNAPPSEENDARKKLDDDRESRIAQDRPGMWIAIEPEASMTVRLGELETLLTNCGTSGCRRGGFNVMSPGNPVKQFSTSIVQTLGEVARLEVRESGALRFETGFEFLRHGVRPAELNPYAVMELPTSLLRLASSLAPYAIGPLPDALAQLVLVGTAGSCLPPFAPGTWGYENRQAPGWMDDWTTLGEDLVVTTVVRFSGEDIVSSPDRCAHRLWSQAYDAFGYPVDRHPAAYDVASGRLEIPS